MLWILTGLSLFFLIVGCFCGMVSNCICIVLTLLFLVSLISLVCFSLDYAHFSETWEELSRFENNFNEGLEQIKGYVQLALGEDSRMSEIGSNNFLYFAFIPELKGDEFFLKEFKSLLWYYQSGIPDLRLEMVGCHRYKLYLYKILLFMELGKGTVYYCEI